MRERSWVRLQRVKRNNAAKDRFFWGQRQRHAPAGDVHFVRVRVCIRGLTRLLRVRAFLLRAIGIAQEGVFGRELVPFFMPGTENTVNETLAQYVTLISALLDPCLLLTQSRRAGVAAVRRRRKAARAATARRVRTPERGTLRKAPKASRRRARRRLTTRRKAAVQCACLGRSSDLALPQARAVASGESAIYPAP